MLNIKRLSIIGIILLLIGVIGGILTFKQMDKSAWDTEEKIITDNGIENIEVSTDNAKVTILPTNDSSTKVEYTGDNEKYRLYTDVDGSTLSIDLKHKPKKLINFNFFSLWSSLTVYLPEEMYESIQSNNNNGHIEIKDLQVKDVAVETDNGRVELENIKSSIINTKAGNGKITLVNVEGHVSGRTNNGSITLVTSNLNRPIDLKTDNGSITVHTKKEPTNAVFDVNVENGKISIFGSSNWDTVIGNGENLIKLTTDNGKITVTK